MDSRTRTSLMSSGAINAPVQAAGASNSRAGFPQKTEEEVREVLSHMDPSCDRDRWKDVAAGVNDELGPDGFDVFDEWSSRAGNYKAASARSVYKSFKPGGGIGFGTVVNFAKQEGYVPKRGVYKKPATDELAERAKMAAERKAVHDAKEAAAAAAARELAKGCLKGSQAATPDFEYLQSKGIQPHGARKGRFPIHDENGQVTWIEPVLLLPMRDYQGALHSLQGITLQGDKWFLKDGAMKGQFFRIGSASVNADGKRVIVLAEGFATAASVHEATGLQVLCCFSAWNMFAVARIMRQRQPDAEFIIAADNDTGCEAKGRGNTGMRVAFDAGMEFGMRVAVPSPGDFNDLMLAEGREAVCAAITSAMVPTESYASVGGPPSKHASHNRRRGACR